MVAGIIFCLFASLVGPYAGFLASGIKRGYKIKDFSDTLPGHGGFLDRFDCGLLMGAFGFCLLSSNFLLKDSLDVDKAMGLLNQMSKEDIA